MMRQSRRLLLLGLTLPSLCLATSSRPASQPVPPLPDFKTRIDYRAWIFDNMCPSRDQHVWDAYEPIVEQLGDPAVWRTDIKEPWDPAEYPDREQACKQARPLVKAFRLAAKDPRPFCGARASLRSSPVTGALSDDFVNHPALSSIRALQRANMALAWRIEGERVNAREMCEALSANLGSNRQLADDAVALTGLVAIFSLNSTYSQARTALAKGVFRDAGELRQALGVLRSIRPPDLSHVFPTEEALALDALQRLFPPRPDGAPPLDREALEKLHKMHHILPGGPPAPTAASVADARDAAARTRAFFAELETAWPRGMPEVKASDLEAAIARHRGTNPLTVYTIGMDDRVYLFEWQARTSHRATVLCYELALHKARTGAYPGQLADLKIADGDDVRIDPFTGKFFGYRLENGEPLLYSRSENGQDDGGKHSPKWGDDANGGPDDYVFWPPQPTQ